MMRGLKISDVTFSSGSFEDLRRGLLGFISCTVNGSIRLDGITLRRTRNRRLALSFPAHRDAHGRDHPFIRPLDSASREAIEEQVLLALRVSGGLP